jgi:hypothetical protein
MVFPELDQDLAVGQGGASIPPQLVEDCLL